MTRTGIVIVSVLVGAVAFWVLLRGDSSRGGRRVAEDREPTELREAHPARAAPTNTETGEPERADPVVALSGTIVVFAPDGTEHAAEDGSFELAGEEAAIHVEVKRGRWQARLAPEGEYFVDSIRLHGRLAFPHDDEVRAPGGEIRASWMRPSVLHVTDAGGAELSDIFVARRTTWKRNNSLRPASDEPLAAVVEAAPSPITLPDADETVAYWVRAPGFAWNEVRAKHRIGGAFRIVLTPAGELEVRFENHRPGSQSVFRLRRRPGNLVCDLSIPAAGPLVLTDIAARDYTASVEIGPSGWEIPVLASAEIGVPAGGRATLVLTLDDPPSDLVRFAGALSIHAGWQELRPRLYVQPIGRRRAGRIRVQQADDGTWDAGMVQPGRYVVSLGGIYLQHVFEVGAAGLSDALIEVPAPADVELRVVDDTGAPVAADGVNFHPRWPRGVGGGSVGNADAKEGGVFHFRTPAGEVMLDVESDHHEVVEGLFRVRPGRNEITLRTRRLCAVVITFTSNGAPVSVAGDIETTVEGVGDDGRARLWASSDMEQTIGVTGPGRYRVTVVRPPEGFQAPADRTITLERGQVLRLSIPLERDD